MTRLAALTLCGLLPLMASAQQADWSHLSHELSAGVEDRQSLLNEFFNDEAPQWHPRGWPMPNSRFMAIAQGTHANYDRLSPSTASRWPQANDQQNDQRAHPHQQWTDLVVEGKPDGHWRYFVNANLTEAELGLDEAYLTLPIGPGTQLKLGQFYSGFGRLNSQHPHDWDFSDQPLPYRRLFGESNLLEKGLQLSILPTPTLMLGLEQLSATNRDQFASDRNQPALTLIFARHAHHWGGGLHSLAGASLGNGYSAHASGHGQSHWWGLDLTIKQWLPNQHYWMLQGEWLGQDQQHTHTTQPDQQGSYLMALYRWHEQWRTGLRHDQAYSNATQLPDVQRTTWLLEHDPTGWLRTRLQLGQEQWEDGTSGPYALISWQASLHWLP